MTAPQHPEPKRTEGAAKVTCPHCASTDVELEALFGGSVSECLYRCRSCRSFFHWVKWR